MTGLKDEVTISICLNHVKVLFPMGFLMQPVYKLFKQSISHFKKAFKMGFVI